MCLFLVTLFGGPRIGGLLWWLFYPGRWESAFKDNWFWPVLGLIFLPWTTIMFVAVAPFGNVSGWDWLWLGFGFMADFMSIASGGYGGRNRYSTSPGY